MPKGIYTLQSKSLRSRLRVHGWRARVAKGGNTLIQRRLKGRKRLAAKA